MWCGWRGGWSGAGGLGCVFVFVCVSVERGEGCVGGLGGVEGIGDKRFRPSGSPSGFSVSSEHFTTITITLFSTTQQNQCALVVCDSEWPTVAAYLSELLHVYNPSRTLRSSSGTRMLEIQQYKRKTHGFRTFSCFGPHIWNSLPQDLRHCSTLLSFKAKLKTSLFSQYFHPN